MSRVPRRVIWLACSAAVLAGCAHGAAPSSDVQAGQESVAAIAGGSATSASPVQQRTTTETSPLCSPDSLQIAVGILAPLTQERGIFFTVRNTTSAACSISGYPTIALAAANEALPFTYERSGSESVTGQPPAKVQLSPGGLGYFVVAGRECNDGSGSAPDQARVSLPNGTSQEIAVAAGPGVPIPSVCTAHASTLHVSPLVDSIRATYPNA